MTVVDEDEQGKQYEVDQDTASRADVWMIRQTTFFLDLMMRLPF